MVVEYRPVIIGGSAIGNFLAYKLTQKGLKPIVIEEDDQIGQPIQCTGLVSDKINKFEKLPKDITKNKLSSARIHFPDGNNLKINGNEILINRESFDKFWYEKAREGGADYLLGERLIKFVTADIVYAKTTKRKFKTDMLIGCDGPMSFVRRHFGIFYKTVPAVQAISKMDVEDDKQANLYFGSKYTNYPFAWSVPEGGDISRVGVFVKDDINNRFGDFMEHIGAQPIERQAGIVPIDKPKQSAFQNTILVGDAACQTKASTGGGLVTGMVCAEIAADAIAKAYEKLDFSEEFLLREYDHQWKKKIIKDLIISLKMRKLINKFDDEDLNGLYEFGSQHRELIEKHGDMDFYSRVYSELKRSSEFRYFIVKKMMKHSALLFDYFF
ncbi:MAG: NAD(P)/FAD-dependent oxidoreductase [Candidatus Thorarchaeota archaeon]|nr:MAG: NAD(P)/FAD-dependent oxidoreductase [Candidatus Thorarchaeota archaeon]